MLKSQRFLIPPVLQTEKHFCFALSWVGLGCCFCKNSVLIKFTLQVRKSSCRQMEFKDYSELSSKTACIWQGSRWEKKILFMSSLLQGHKLWDVYEANLNFCTSLTRGLCL